MNFQIGDEVIIKSNPTFKGSAAHRSVEPGLAQITSVEEWPAGSGRQSNPGCVVIRGDNGQELWVDMDSISLVTVSKEEEEAAVASILNPVMQEIDRVVAEAEAALPDVRTWIIEQDRKRYGDDEWHTRCPWCDAFDEIHEHDVGVRWNTLSLTDGTTADAHTGDDEFEGDGWICGSCVSQALEAPPGFTISDWY